MPPTIRLLSEEAINQIAAGEVIENPASIVKELVENALDAQASFITIETRGGGFQLIRIEDNGTGMGPEDALLCLTRHATSKITQAEDLSHLCTLGFRGEALASIAAVSKLTLLTATEHTAGVRIEVEGGKIIETSPCARKKGTTIEVRSLFYNVPARKRFQKTAASSTAAITRLAITLSLSHPAVQLSLVHQEREAFTTFASSSSKFFELLKKRAEQFLEKTLFLSMEPVDYVDSPIEIHGLISAPENARESRMHQYVFINRRAVFCPLVSYAIREGYGTRLASHLHPAYIIHLNIPSSLIDVNVHPQKKEVRLREQEKVRKKIIEAIHASLQKKEGLSTVEKENASVYFSSLSPSFFQEPFNTSSHFSPLLLKEEGNTEKQPLLPWEEEIYIIGIFSHYLIVDARSVCAKIAFLRKEEKKEGLLFVNLTAAYSRLLFETLTQNKENTGKEQQILLLPLTFSFSSLETECMMHSLDLLCTMGIAIRPIGKTSFIVEAIPSFMEEKELFPVLEKMLEEILVPEDSKNRENTQEKSRAVASFLCRFAQQKKHSFALEEAKMLWNALLLSSSPYYCPQGKPIMWYLDAHEIEKNFFP